MSSFDTLRIPRSLERVQMVLKKNKQATAWKGLKNTFDAATDATLKSQKKPAAAASTLKRPAAAATATITPPNIDDNFEKIDQDDGSEKREKLKSMRFTKGSCWALDVLENPQT